MKSKVNLSKYVTEFSKFSNLKLMLLMFSKAVPDRRTAAGFIVNSTYDFSGVHHIIHIAADGDARQMDLFRNLFAGEKAVRVVREKVPNHMKRGFT